MKKTIILLLILPLFGIAQEEQDKFVILKPQYFGGKEGAFDKLVKILRKGDINLSLDYNKVSIDVRDLNYYFPQGRHYRYFKKLEVPFKTRFIYSEEEILQRSDSILKLNNIPNKWRKKLRTIDAAKVIIEQLELKREIKYTNKEFFIVDESSGKDSSYFYQLIYNSQNLLDSINYGYILKPSSDTVIWHVTLYEYREKELEVKTDIQFYTNGRLKNAYPKKPHKTFSTWNDFVLMNKKWVSCIGGTTEFSFDINNYNEYQVISEVFHREEGKADITHSIIKQYNYSKITNREVLRQVSYGKYTHNKQVELRTVSEDYQKSGFYEKREDFQYDEQERWVSSMLIVWDENNNVIETQWQKVDYHPNNIDYVFKKNVVGEKVPLYYKITFFFTQ